MKVSAGCFTRDRVLGVSNYKWKGDLVGYFGLHTWVKRTLGKASQCEDCGNRQIVQWANVSKEYKRNVEDWKQLCIVCHRRFDGITKFSKEEANEIRNRCINGETQVALAKEYLVDQGTISNIMRDKIKYYVR